MLALNKSTDNRGISLIELIVVIAIMSVLIGAGAISLVMLTGAEAKQAANRFDAELNDVKTGNLAKAGEVVELTYIDIESLSDADKAAKAAMGIDKSGYYSVKDSYTIMNTAPGSKLSVPLAGTSDPSHPDDKTKYNDREYSYVGKGRVIITAVYSDGTSVDAKTSPVDIQFSRKDGRLEGASANLDKITFSSGRKTFTITFEKETGTHKLSAD